MDEPFDVGVFSAEPGKKGFSAASVLAFLRTPIRRGKQRVTLVVKERPMFAGVDAYSKRIDRNSDDNLSKVEVGEPSRR